MEIEIVEDQVVARLQPLAALGNVVIPIPETDLELEKMPTENSRLIVGCSEIDYGAIKSINQVSQNEDVCIDITIQSRKLRGDFGIYDMKKRITKLLLGFQPDGILYPMTLKKFGFAVRERSVFQYVLTFEGVSVVVQDQPLPDTPVLTEVHINS